MTITMHAFIAATDLNVGETVQKGFEAFFFLGDFL